MPSSLAMPTFLLRLKKGEHAHFKRLAKSKRMSLHNWIVTAGHEKSLKQTAEAVKEEKR